MIYSPGRFAFIHQPRTGGTSVVRSVMQASPEDTTSVQGILTIPGTTVWKHSRAVDLFRFPGWEHAFKWSIARSPWDVLESEWSFWHRQIQRLQETNGKCRKGHGVEGRFWDRAELVSGQDFETYCRHQYRQLKPGSGRWRWWCCGMLGEELGVEPVLYAELQAQWPELCDRMGIPPVPLQHVNGFGRAENIEWTPDLHRWVNSVFADDIQRFGFRVPEHITV